MENINNYESIIRYWENKRFYLNILASVAMLIGLLLSKSLFVVPFEELIIFSFFCIVGVNVVYSLGSYTNIICIMFLGFKSVEWKIICLIVFLVSTSLTGILGFVSMYLFTPF